MPTEVVAERINVWLEERDCLCGARRAGSDLSPDLHQQLWRPRAVAGRYPQRQLDDIVVQTAGPLPLLCTCAQTGFMYRCSVHVEATQS